MATVPDGGRARGGRAPDNPGRPRGASGSGGQVWAPRLYLPAGIEGRGFLIFSQSPSETTLIELTPALVRPILALYAARMAEQGLPAPARGWMSALKLAQRVAGQSDNLLPTEEQTLRAYISKINKNVRQAAARSGLVPAPVLIEQRSMLGFRLATDKLVVIDGTEAREAPKQTGAGRCGPPPPIKGQNPNETQQ